MGTRGFLGLVIDSTEKITYNHWDSYPSGLGVEVLSWLRDGAVNFPDLLMTRARELRMVDRDSVPTEDDVTRLTRFSWNAAEHGGSSDLRAGQEWYDLLRKTQGNLQLMMEAGVAEDASSFPLGSLWAEWGYIINLDHMTLEVYRGFQTAPHTAGRFAERASSREVGGASGSTYYPCALVATFPFNALPQDDAFVRQLTREEDDD